MLKDQRLSIELLHPYIVIEKELAAQKVLYGRLEPKKSLVPQGTKGKSDPQLTALLAWTNAFKTFEWERAFPDPELAKSDVGRLLELV